MTLHRFVSEVFNNFILGELDFFPELSAVPCWVFLVSSYVRMYKLKEKNKTKEKAMVNNSLFVFGILKHLLCVDVCLAFLCPENVFVY